MEFRKDVDVLDAAGDKVGEVDRVVLDSRTREVTHIVVRKGFLLVEDRVVPVSLIESADDDGVRLRQFEGKLKDLPPFEEQYYVQAGVQTGPSETEATEFAHPVYAYPPVYTYPFGGPFAGTEPRVQPFVVETERNIPEGAVALKQGAKVITSDDEHVGDVDEVLTDHQSGQATHFVISSGLLLKSRKLIPYNWVSYFEEGRVYLAVQSELVERLPKYEEPEE
jgi:uncharacterized protein YrrD